MFVTKLHLGATNLMIDYNTFFSNASANSLGGRRIIQGNDKIYIAGSLYESGLPLVNAFDDTYSCIGQEGFVSVFQPNSNGVNDLIYSSYFGGSDRSQLYDIDLIEECDRIIFVGYVHDPIPGFQGQINMTYNGYQDFVLGIVDINQTTTNTLVDIAYSHHNTNSAGLTAKHKEYTDIIYAGGWYFMAAWKLTTDVCPGDCPCPPSRDSWFTLISTWNAPPCSTGQCSITHEFEIPEGITCYSHYKIDDGSGYSTVTLIPQSGTLNFIDRCIDQGTTLNITLALLKGADDPTPCIIQKSIGCICECPPERADWLDLYIRKAGSECTQYQCYWIYELEVPPSYSCFTHYRLEKTINGITTIDIAPVLLETGTLTDFGCMEPGTEIILKFYLMRGPDDPNPCIIEKTELCECDCPDNNEWLNLTVEKNSPNCSEDQCEVLVTFSEIPSCYDYCTISDSDGQEHYSGAYPIITAISKCIDAGTDITFTASFSEGQGDPEPCVMSKTAGCNIFIPQEACTPDCFEDEFLDPPKQLTIPLDDDDCPGCFIRITYTWRIACPSTNHWQDVQILGIEKYRDEEDPEINCDACTDEEIYKKALAAVIFENEMEFMPRTAQDPCSYIFRIVSAACWATWVYIVYDLPSGEVKYTITVLEPCESDCCIRNMMVCRYEDRVTLTDIMPRSLTNDPSCDNMFMEKPFLEPVPCEGICDWLEGMTDYYGKQSVEYDIYDMDKFFDHNPNNSSLMLNVSNTESVLRILIDKASGSKASIIISNIPGEIVYSKETSLNKGLNRFEIDKSNFFNGVYVYSIVIDGVLIKSGKFNIVK